MLCSTKKGFDEFIKTSSTLNSIISSKPNEDFNAPKMNFNNGFDSSEVTLEPYDNHIASREFTLEPHDHLIISMRP